MYSLIFSKLELLSYKIIWIISKVDKDKCWVSSSIKSNSSQLRYFIKKVTRDSYVTLQK